MNPKLLISKGIKLTTLASNVDEQESLALQFTKGESGLGKFNLVVLSLVVSRAFDKGDVRGEVGTYRVRVNVGHDCCMYCRKLWG